MIYPEEDEQLLEDVNHKEYPYDLTSLNTHSPVLPLHFDKGYLPRTTALTQASSAKRSC